MVETAVGTAAWNDIPTKNKSVGYTQFQQLISTGSTALGSVMERDKI